MLGHVMKQRLEEQDGNVSVFTMPYQLGKLALKGVWFQDVLVMDQIMVRCDQFRSHPIGIVFAFGYGPAFWNCLFSTL
jgi:hypothetical protein